MANIWNPYRFAYSEYVVPLLCLSLILIGVIIRWLIEGRKRNEYIWRLLLMFWIFTILSATILGRGRYRGDNLNLHLFWTFRYAWTNHSWRHWYDIIGNMMLYSDDCCVHFQPVLFFPFLWKYISILRIQACVSWMIFLIILMEFYWDLQYG